MPFETVPGLEIDAASTPCDAKGLLGSDEIPIADAFRGWTGAPAAPPDPSRPPAPAGA